MTTAASLLRASLFAAIIAYPAAAHAWPWQDRDARAQQAQPPVSAQAVDPAALSLRINELEAKIRELYGETERLQFENRKLREQLQTAGGAPAGTGEPARDAGPEIIAAPETLPSSGGPAGPGAPPQVLGTLPGGGTMTGPMDGGGGYGPAPEPGAPLVLAPGGIAPGGGAADNLSIAEPPTDNPEDAYALAEGFLQRRDYELAEASFRRFAEDHPEHARVSDALYGVGESLYQRGEYRDALEPFLTVATEHKDSARAPQSLLRLGQSLAQIGEKDNACATFGEVERRYPQARDTRAQASREKQRLGC